MKWKYLLSVILFLLAGFIVYTLYKAGSFRSIEPHQKGEVLRIIKDIPGPEDLDISYLTNTLFISSTDRRNEDNEGAIFGLPLESESIPYRIPHTFSDSFHPHGISVFESDSSTYLHVVNHNENGDYIEFFQYRSDSLHHFKSIHSPMMCCPNDVLSVAPDRCYITNDHGNKSGFMRTLEDYLTLPLSNILYYDGSSFNEAYSGMSYANGINISPNGKYIYATETTGRKLLTFIPTSEGSLKKVGEINLKTGLDNIDVDQDGKIWIASHPKLLAFVKHAKDSTAISPSQVIRITPGVDNHTDFTIDEIFLDDGTNLSGSSVAVHHQGKVYVGVVFDHKVLMMSFN